MKNKIFNLKSKFSPAGDQPQAINKLTQAFESGEKYQTLMGVTGSGKTFTMANVIQNLGRKTLVLAHNKTLAAQLYSEFKEFFPDNAVEYFVSYYDYYQPEAYVVGSDTYIEKDASVNDEIDKLRHSATQSLLERDDVIVVSSVSCIYSIGSPDEYKSQRLTLFTGEKISPSDLLKKLVAMQFARNDYDFYRGTFRTRGDVVEVFPAHEAEYAVRIEFFDDEVESISIIDPLLGKVVKSLNKITVYPKSHYVVGEQNMKRAVESIKLELRERLNQLEAVGKLVERQRLEQRTMLDLEMLEEMGFCSGIENYSFYLSGRSADLSPPTLIDFFGDDFLMIIDESHMTIPQVGAMYRGDRARKTNLVEFGFRLPSALENRPLEFFEFEKIQDKVMFVSATPANYELEKTQGEFVQQIIRPTGLLDPLVEVRDSKTQVEDVLGECRKSIERGHRILITTLTKRLAEDLTKYLNSAGISVKYLHSDIDTLERVEIIRDLRLGEFDVLVGINLLREGLDIPEVALVAILDADKEGFLRSERSLIQTIGRAARNSDGRVILYANKKTESMKKAMHETERRRHIQEEHNRQNGLNPETIIKGISGGIIETLRGKESQQQGKGKKGKLSKQFDIHDDKALDEKIKSLKVQMKKAAKQFKFEEAAKLRDEIKILSGARLFL